MALQAVLRRLLIILSMAVDAPTHFELRDGHEVSDMGVLDEVKLVDLFDGAMTRLTFDARLDMAVVAKLHVFGQTMNLNPFDRLLFYF